MTNVHLLILNYDEHEILQEIAPVGGEAAFVAVQGRLELRLVAPFGRAGNDVLATGWIADGDRIAAARSPEIGSGAEDEGR